MQKLCSLFFVHLYFPTIARYILNIVKILRAKIVKYINVPKRKKNYKEKILFNFFLINLEPKRIFSRIIN